MFAGNVKATPITMWIIGDLDSPCGLQTVVDALKHLEHEDTATRLGFVHFPSSVDPRPVPRFSTILYQLLSTSALQTLSSNNLSVLALIEEIVLSGHNTDNLDSDGRIVSEKAQNVFEGTPLHALTSSGWSTTDLAAAAEFWRVGTDIARSLGIKEGQTHILVNGRVGFALLVRQTAANPPAYWSCDAWELPCRGLCRTRTIRVP